MERSIILDRKGPRIIVVLKLEIGSNMIRLLSAAQQWWFLSERVQVLERRFDIVKNPWIDSLPVLGHLVDVGMRQVDDGLNIGRAQTKQIDVVGWIILRIRIET